MKNSLARIATLLCGALLAIAAGCASVPMSTDTEDSAAKAFTPRTGKANIYVYRNETLGAAVTVRVSLDGKIIGSTGPRTYFLLEVDPGSHQLISHAETNTVVMLNAAAGRNYFVWQEMKMGMMQARTNLQLVSEEVGRAGVMECKRAMPEP